jgi:hypothetical protein
MICWNSLAGVVQRAALAFFVRAGRDAGRCTTGAPGHYGKYYFPVLPLPYS